MLELTARSDFNGVLSDFRPKLERSMTNNGQYRIVKKEIAIIHDIRNSIVELKSRGMNVKLVWLNVHGKRSGITLGSENPTDNDQVLINHPFSFRAQRDASESEEKMQANVNQLEDAFDELDEDAAIVLDSCCTGQFYGSKQVDGIDLPCIARTIAE